MTLELDAAGLPRPKYPCHIDICTEGLQFCNNVSKRCAECSAYLQDCFTNFQQQNCTKFCMEKWQDEYLKSRPSPTEKLHDTVGIVGGVISFLLLVMIFLQICRHRGIRQCLRSMCTNICNKMTRSGTATAGGNRTQGVGIEDNVSHRSERVDYQAVPEDDVPSPQVNSNVSGIRLYDRSASPTHRGAGRSSNQHGAVGTETNQVSVYAEDSRSRNPQGGRMRQGVTGVRDGPSGKTDSNKTLANRYLGQEHDEATEDKQIDRNDRLDIKSFDNDLRTQSPNVFAHATGAHSMVNGHLPRSVRENGYVNLEGQGQHRHVRQDQKDHHNREHVSPRPELSRSPEISR